MSSLKQSTRSRYCVQQRVGVRREEVLELDQRVGILLLHRGDELFDEGEVRLAFDALARIAEVEHVVEQISSLLVPTSSVTGRQCFGGMPAQARVERELADGDAHAVGAEIAQAEDALSVGDDDDADVLLGPVVEDLRDAAPCRPA